MVFNTNELIIIFIHTIIRFFLDLKKCRFVTKKKKMIIYNTFLTTSSRTDNYLESVYSN